MKKVIYTVAVDGYSPEICALTHPLIHHYAHKIGAEFCVINGRRWPDLPPVYEKLQIHYLAQELQADWNIYIDSDALIHPDMFDVTNHIHKDTVMHNGCDMAGNRWRYDKYFMRDGRHIGSGNWFAVASDWCIDLWRPPDDISYEECLDNIFPTAFEQAPTMKIKVKNDKGEEVEQTVDKAVITREHLIDDYILSRNIAKYGLKFLTVRDLQAKLGCPHDVFLWHQYVLTVEDKIKDMKKTLKNWGLQIASSLQTSDV